MAVKTMPDSGTNGNLFDATRFKSTKRGKDGAGLYLILGARTGWALRSADGRVRSGTRLFPADPLAGKGLDFMNFLKWLRTIREVAGPLDRVAFKDERKNPSGPIDGKEDGFLWHLDAWVKEHGILLVRTPSVTIEENITECDSDPGQESMKVVRTNGWRPGSEREAEAIALMLRMETHPLWGKRSKAIVVHADSDQEASHE